MKLVLTIAAGAALALAGTTILGLAPAAAQDAAPMLSKEERAALFDLQTALETKNYSAASSALQTAQSAARTGYARYLASALQLRLGIETNNFGLQSSAIDAMIESGSAPAAELPQLYRNQAALLQQAGKFERAEASFNRYIELSPNDPDALIALSQVKQLRKKPQEAVALTERAIDMRKASGQPVPEGWYKRALNMAMMGGLQPQSLKFSRELAAAYPSMTNWRDAAFIYRDVTHADPEAALDAWRLQRAAKALAGERDYLLFSQALNSNGLPAETKAVLEEGVAAKMVSPTEATYKELIATSAKRAAADRAGNAAKLSAALAGGTGAASVAAGNLALALGDYPKAATLYRAALTKGAVDTDLANTRLGIALAMAGQRGEAATAFQAVSGPRADLAALWLAWLNRSA